MATTTARVVFRNPKIDFMLPTRFTVSEGDTRIAFTTKIKKPWVMQHPTSSQVVIDAKQFERLRGRKILATMAVGTEISPSDPVLLAISPRSLAFKGFRQLARDYTNYKGTLLAAQAKLATDGKTPRVGLVFRILNTIQTGACL